ncbi:gamma-interferon-inducible lysosomal thiol reductase-like [Neodiprion virginianus]|uniref:gamma-interferon-inducible lysosomal thiol reductase-like n=1 Tax=Neodiprion virginianus TaxID=2961670 RepID=UPI001EE7256E|nr:gamma-interferon-inducible lysosomal thiol reductase-like [Neodiprion virginianus]
MGLGSFRYRLIILLCTALVLYQSSKYWPSLQFSDDPPQSSAAKSLAAQELVEGIDIAEPPKLDVQKVLVSVYYEALCPDSKFFVVKQLLPTFQKIKENLQVELIPYGKAKTVETPTGYEFTCQHGPLECEANIIHACVIDLVNDQLIQLDYISCMIQDNMQPERVMHQCAAKVNLDVTPIEKCYKGTKGKELLAKFGEMTDDLSPKVVFIPTITLDKDSSNQAAILKNLLKEVCSRLNSPPLGCA